MPQDILVTKAAITAVAKTQWEFLGEFPSLRYPDTPPSPMRMIAQDHHYRLEIGTPPPRGNLGRICLQSILCAELYIFSILTLSREASKGLTVSVANVVSSQIR